MESQQKITSDSPICEPEEEINGENPIESGRLADIKMDLLCSTRERL